MDDPKTKSTDAGEPDTSDIGLGRISLSDTGLIGIGGSTVASHGPIGSTENYPTKPSELDEKV